MKTFIELLNGAGETLAADATPEAVAQSLKKVLANRDTLKNRVSEIDERIATARRNYILTSFEPVFANREQAEAVLAKDESAFINSLALTKDGAAIAAVVNASLANGDYPGHPFHGNQHVDSKESSGAEKQDIASHNADERSKAAGKMKKGSEEANKAHIAAASAHEHAAKLHEKEGNTEKADYHLAIAAWHNKRVGGAASAGANTTAARNFQLGNRDKADAEKATLPPMPAASVASADGRQLTEMQQKEQMVRDIQNRDNCDWATAMGKAFREHADIFKIS